MARVARIAGQITLKKCKTADWENTSSRLYIGTDSLPKDCRRKLRKKTSRIFAKKRQEKFRPKNRGIEKTKKTALRATTKKGSS